MDAGLRVKGGAGSMLASVLGTAPSLARQRNLRLQSGRFFDEEDDEASRRVAVLGARVAKTLFPGEDAVGRDVHVRGLPLVRARDQLLLDVSHELRSPLTRLKVALALLPDSAKKAQAEADAAEMDAITTELLELEHLRDGRTLRTTREDLVELLHEAAETYQDAPPGIRVSATPPAIPLDLDVDGVRTVLRNLLDNAVKYSLPDSHPIELSVTRENDTVMVRVIDDGPGIPESDLQSIFDPFFRVDRSRSRKTGGYGLGLSICKRIVEAHGGQITAANNPVRGTCFTLIFPIPGTPGS